MSRAEVARVPWHRSLVVRVFALGALIAVVAVAAATWATVRATTVAVHDQQQETLHADAASYDALLGYAATHRSWAGAGDLVDRLAREHGGTISVTDVDGAVLVSSSPDGPAHLDPARARAHLDPLDVDTVLMRTSQDPAQSPATGSTAREPEPVDEDCTGPVVPNECRQGVVGPTLALDPRIEGPFEGDGTRSAYADLQARVDACLTAAGLPPTSQLLDDLEVAVPYNDHRRVVSGCLDDALRTVLSADVAPPALLQVTGQGSTARVFWDLSGHSQRRILLLAGAVLVLTLLLCALLATTIAVPLRRMATAALRAGDGDLDARVPARRRDEVGQLARAFNQMADRRQQLEEARRQLVSDVSHELRTPLANVRGWVEAARDGVAEPDDELMDSLLEESLHLQRLVDDLHDLSLGDAGELRLERETVELGSFLEQVASSFRPSAREAGVALDVESAAGAIVVADPVRLRQAVANLVANAIRHTPGGGRVVLRGAADAIAVSDDGEGIPAEELPHVFDRFRRVDPSRSRATGGSGLGLAVVRQLVEAHGGSATATSKPGRGTEVTLRFPGAVTGPAARTPG